MKRIGTATMTMTPTRRRHTWSPLELTPIRVHRRHPIIQYRRKIHHLAGTHFLRTPVM